MFSLIIGRSPEDTMIPAERLLERTEPSLKVQFTSENGVDFDSIKRIPALVMPELQDSTRRQVATVGTIESARIAGRECRYRFVPARDIAEIPSREIEALAPALDIDASQWGDFTRTHWAVKDVDLFRALLARQSSPTTLAPKVFAIPEGPPEADLISIMMPFDPTFTPVQTALSSAASGEGWRCQRADDIWESDAIIQDIVALIARSRAVICDLSNRNPNVFYETGIAHTLGRNVILLARQESDVPFDLRHLRYVQYMPNSQGIGDLVAQVMPRLRDLMSR